MPSLPLFGKRSRGKITGAHAVRPSARVRYVLECVAALQRKQLLRESDQHLRQHGFLKSVVHPFIPEGGNTGIHPGVSGRSASAGTGLTARFPTTFFWL